MANKTKRPSVDTEVYDAADDLVKYFARDLPFELNDADAEEAINDLAKQIQEWLEGWTESIKDGEQHA